MVRHSAKKILSGTLIASLLPFLLVELFRPQLYHVMEIASYLVFHNAAEFFSIMVSLSIFGVGWFTYEQSRNRHVLFLSLAFLATGLMDFMHTMSYAGMPSFFTPNSANKSTQFWIAARLFTAAALLVSAGIYPERPSRWLSRPVLMSAALVTVALVFVGVTFFPLYLPATFIEGVGLTPFKKKSEYLIIGMLCLATVAYWRRMTRTGDRLIIYYLAAFILCIFSELVFAVYKSVFDTYNVLGHAYKVAAFFLIYRSVFATSVSDPYLQVADTNERLQREIADHQRTEEALKAERQRLHDILETLPAYFVLMTPDYHVPFANRFFRERFGEAHGRRCFEYLFGRNEPCEVCGTFTVLQTMAPHEWEWTGPDGRDYHVYDFPFTDADGSIVILEMGIDISDRKKAVEELRQMKNYLENIINSMPSILVGMDPKEIVTQWNLGATRATGIPREEALGQPIRALLPDFSPWIETLRATEQRRPASHERLLVEKEGERHFYDLILFPLVANCVEGAVVRIDDTTERTRIQELMIQTEKMMSVGGLAAGMAHEINNPLGIINQAAQNIERRLTTDLPGNRQLAAELGLDLEQMHTYFDKRQIFQFIGNIQESTARAARIVANMLQFSRQSTTAREPASLSELADRAVELAANDYDLKKRFDFRSIEIVRDYDPTLPQVPVAAEEIEQVILNLLKNAAQAMAANPPEKKPKITLQLRREGPSAVLEVEDNGPGMDDQIRQRVFEPFFTTKEPGVGTGLGLSVSFMIVTNNHQGSLTVDSAPGAGARFTVRLPLSQDE